MKIAILTVCFNRFNNEAMNITMNLISQELSKLGHEVFVISHRNPHEVEFEKYKKVVAYRPISRKSLNLPFFINPFTVNNHIIAQVCGLKKAQKRFNVKFDIVINTFSSPFISLRASLIRLIEPKAKIVGLYKSESSFNLFKWYYLLNLHDVIVTPSQSLKDLLKLKGVNKPINIIRSPINLDKFKPKPFKRPKQYINNKIILYYGHFNKFKGVEYLIRALKFLELDAFKLVLIPSKDQDKRFYDGIINKEGVAKNVDILPANSDIVKYINLAKMVVLPYPDLTSTEANPSCILESMACGTPVVTSDLEQIKELVKDKESVLLARPKDPKDLAEKIKIALTDKKLTSKIKKKGLQISSKFSVSNICKDYIEVFRNN